MLLFRKIILLFSFVYAIQLSASYSAEDMKNFVKMLNSQSLENDLKKYAHPSDSSLATRKMWEGVIRSVVQERIEKSHIKPFVQQEETTSAPDFVVLNESTFKKKKPKKTAAQKAQDKADKDFLNGLIAERKLAEKKDLNNRGATNSVPVVSSPIKKTVMPVVFDNEMQKIGRALSGDKSVRIPAAVVKGFIDANCVELSEMINKSMFENESTVLKSEYFLSSEWYENVIDRLIDKAKIAENLKKRCKSFVAKQFAAILVDAMEVAESDDDL